MKNVVSAVVGLIALVSTGVALAAGPWSNSVVIATVEIDGVAGGNGTETYLSFASTPTGKPACGTAGQAVMSGSVDNVKSMTSVATAAFLSGHSVKLYWTGACTGSYAQFNAISMQ
jgi:hypothetical protein